MKVVHIEAWVSFFQMSDHVSTQYDIYFFAKDRGSQVMGEFHLQGDDLKAELEKTISSALESWDQDFDPSIVRVIYPIVHTWDEDLRGELAMNFETRDLMDQAVNNQLIVQQ